MRDKIKDKRLQAWLDTDEFDCLQKYARKNHLTISELIRGWIHEIMKREGYDIREPSLPETKFKNKGAK